MLEKFNLGDRICVSWEAEEYGGSHGGKVGIIERVSNYHGKYGVELKGLHNDLSENGLFWFSEESLFPQEEIDKEKMEKMAKAQIELTDTFYDYFCKAFNFPPRQVEIKKVIFNNPATIVFWSDGKKTVIKCADNETFDEEKGLAMAISKRVLGNMGNYYNEFKKWLPDDVLHDCRTCKFINTDGLEYPCISCTTDNDKWELRRE